MIGDIGAHFPEIAAKTALIAFAIAAATTPLVRLAARRSGAVAQPKEDRWHAKPTAMFGGVAIFFAVMAATLLEVVPPFQVWIVIGASALLFAVGLVDDLVQIKPYQKLIGQIIAAAVVIHYGLVLPWTSSTTVNMSITFVWLIGVTNAVNMLDNMDGLSAGVAAIAAAFLAANFQLNHQSLEAVILTGFTAALVGFLIYNYNPASIFMGDCGSMFIGFFLASMALLSGAGGGRSRSVASVLAVPVLVLLVPIFDTTFVTLMRKLAGRAASEGGRDHTSHRLVALGLSERRAVGLLYVLAFSSGAVSLLVRHTRIDLSAAAIASFVVILTFLGIHLGRVRVYDEQEVAAATEKPLVSLLLELSYKRRIFEVLLDATLAFGAYYLAYVLRFGPFDGGSDWRLFIRTVPFVVCIKVLTFLALGVYRGLWRYVSIEDAIRLGRAALVGSVFSVIAFLFAFRFSGFSRTVFIADAVLMVVLIVASRFAFRILDRIVPLRSRNGRRVLVYGAGDAGELLVRELSKNAALDSVPVAFVDDDPRKVGRFIHGLRVYDAAAPLGETRQRVAFDEVMISTAKVPLPRLQLCVAECQAIGVAVKRMRITIERVADDEVGWMLRPDGETPATIIANIPAVYSFIPPLNKKFESDH